MHLGNALLCCFYYVYCLKCHHVFFNFIFLITSMVPSNFSSWNIWFSASEISFHKYSPYIMSFMLKIARISNINSQHSTIFHSFHARKIQNHFCNNQLRNREASIKFNNLSTILIKPIKNIKPHCLSFSFGHFLVMSQTPWTLMIPQIS